MNRRYIREAIEARVENAIRGLERTAAKIVDYETNDYYDGDTAYTICEDMQRAFVKLLSALGLETDIVNSFDYVYGIRTNFDRYVSKHDTIGKVFVVKLLKEYADILEDEGADEVADELLGMSKKFARA